MKNHDRTTKHAKLHIEYFPITKESYGKKERTTETLFSCFSHARKWETSKQATTKNKYCETMGKYGKNFVQQLEKIELKTVLCNIFNQTIGHGSNVLGNEFPLLPERLF